jgi:hypothetical protein
MRKVFFVKRFLDGEPLESIGNEDLPAVARLLAEVHAKGIVTDDAHADNFLKTPSGQFAFIDYGRAMVFGVRPAPAFAVGKELAKLYREGFGYKKDLFHAFLREYYGETHASFPRRLGIAFGVRTAIFFRNLRKGRGR